MTKRQQVGGHFPTRGRQVRKRRQVCGHFPTRGRQVRKRQQVGTHFPTRGRQVRERQQVGTHFPTQGRQVREEDKLAAIFPHGAGRFGSAAFFTGNANIVESSLLNSVDSKFLYNYAEHWAYTAQCTFYRVKTTFLSLLILIFLKPFSTPGRLALTKTICSHTFCNQFDKF